MNEPSEFGKELRRLREKQFKISLRQAAARIGSISDAYLSQLETGHRPPPHPPVVIKIAEAYQTDVSRLLYLAGYMGSNMRRRETRLRDKYAEAIVTHPDCQHALEQGILQMLQSEPREQAELLSIVQETVPTKEHLLGLILDDDRLRIDPNVPIQDFSPEAQELLIHVYKAFNKEHFHRTSLEAELASKDQEP